MEFLPVSDGLSVCLSLCPSVRLSVCLSVRLSVCLSVCLSVRLSVCPHSLARLPASEIDVGKRNRPKNDNPNKPSRSQTSASSHFVLLMSEKLQQKRFSLPDIFLRSSMISLTSLLQLVYSSTSLTYRAEEENRIESLAHNYRLASHMASI